MFQKKIKVGIITMHKVLNAGSALQAWALYRKIEQLGYSCEIIDYQYPNRFHLSHRQNLGTKQHFITQFIARLKFFVLYRTRNQRRRFATFWRSAWKSSATKYSTPESLQQNPPMYDIYMVGSDQVWNPEFMHGDPSFFCTFASNKARISYASSFAKSEIPTELYQIYKEFLLPFSSISVREEGGRNLVKKLTGKDAMVVCDPTLLLTKTDYEPLIAQSEIKIKKPYLLAYILSYAYNPYPTIHKVIEQISKERNLRVIYLLANSIDDYHFGNSITNAGPNEFLHLIAEAECIVTSSFHGVAFALNFEKEFYTILPKNIDTSNRIYSLLKIVGALDRIILNEPTFKLPKHTTQYKEIIQKIQQYRNSSIEYLEKSLKKCV